MKRAAILLFMLVLGATLFAQANNETQKFLGSWKNNTNEYTVTFNSNGTCKILRSNQTYESKYFIVSSRIYFNNFSGYVSSFEFAFSPNGNILYLQFVNETSSLWFEKQ